MIAFHSNWTRPFTSKNKNMPYFIEDYELLTTILSALKWREKNGYIKMITDNVGADYYKSIGLEDIWNLGISTELQDAIPNSIDESIFWAAGKLFALRSMKAPCVMLDTDFIVWDSLLSLLENCEIAAIHSENLDFNIYPPKTFFNMTDDYFENNVYDWTVLPCNTAFAYIKNQEFLNFYVKCSIDFIEHALSSNDNLKYMVFAEQRMLSMCAKKLEIPIKLLSDIETLFSNNQRMFTHIWGQKRELKINLSEREAFCLKCINRIRNDYPSMDSILKGVPQFQKYYLKNTFLTN